MSNIILMSKNIINIYLLQTFTKGDLGQGYTHTHTHTRMHATMVHVKSLLKNSYLKRDLDPHVQIMI